MIEVYNIDLSLGFQLYGIKNMLRITHLSDR